MTNQEITDGRRSGASPLVEPGVPTLMRLPARLRNQLDEYGRKHGLPSRTAVVREACRRLLAEEAAA
jgi:hypothetical protein